MKKYFLALLFAGLLIGCGNNEDKKTKEPVSIGTQSSESKPKKETPKTSGDVVSTGVNFDSKGVGPFTSIELGDMDDALAEKGEELFKMNCTACHKTDKKFIGPAIKGIFERRNPEWIANMIINPEVMVKEDPLAKQLLIEYNGSPMANQGLSQDEVRAILEYFRTL